MRAFSKPTFNVSKTLKVIFMGESAVDDGGPRREFFQLLLKDAFTSSGLFIGWPHHTIPLHHVEAVAIQVLHCIWNAFVVVVVARCYLCTHVLEN